MILTWFIIAKRPNLLMLYRQGEVQVKWPSSDDVAWKGL